MFVSIDELSQCVVQCKLCPRLVVFRREAPIRAAFRHEKYYRKPVPGFGDLSAWLLILGLAPSAQGANRTGRIFTGDESGRFLMTMLHKMGLANQPFSISSADELKLIGCYLTAAVKCVPPQNRPLPEEFGNCSQYLENEFFLLKKLRAVLALGGMAFKTYLHFLKNQHVKVQHPPPFSHGCKFLVPGWPTLYGSYHPSPQNTYTKKLTESRFQALLTQIIKDQK